MKCNIDARFNSIGVLLFYVVNFLVGHSDDALFFCAVLVGGGGGAVVRDGDEQGDGCCDDKRGVYVHGERILRVCVKYIPLRVAQLHQHQHSSQKS